MGRLIYGSDGQSLDIDDRALAHLRVVFMNKLRRAEPFLFHHTEASGLRSLWIHPAVPIVFHFYGSRQPALNREWVESLMIAASGAHGLSVLPEPAAATPAPNDQVPV
ncbi:ATP-dependent DNA ligase [Microbacterium sp. CFBP9034]|uniref:DUF7882 family protein n=1 Tax=Microbacterium sp. CFBP9034 TaxID=3096540 RepID=UPI002A69EF86|nr:ATP-dependent DNA ligase [Microbacterium sp. CFBP9034]MDY0911114.1 ATP-dependent DNA ligase [Microbacterium sp. CFBP9034]